LAFLISAPTFIVPYLFVYSPELMLKGSIFYVGFRIVTAFIAISGISMAFLGFARLSLNVIERVIILTSAVCLIPHVWYLNMFGYMVIFGIFWRQSVYPRLLSRGTSDSGK
jgi:TRAP-type uncharacterized transport system fused permease subunit